jgi:hypothetical protein
MLSGRRHDFRAAEPLARVTLKELVPFPGSGMMITRDTCSWLFRRQKTCVACFVVTSEYSTGTRFVSDTRRTVTLHLSVRGARAGVP